MSTINISSDIAYFFEQYDLLAATPSPLSTFTFDFDAGLSDFGLAVSASLPITSVASTQIIAGDGLGNSVTLTGSGFGPVATIAELETAVANGLANGSFSQIVIDGPSTAGAAPATLMTIDITAAGYTMTSGNQSLSVTGSLPATMTQIYGLMDVFGRAATASTLDAAGRSLLISDLSAFAITGFELTDAGVSLFQYSSTSSQLVFTVDGYTSTLSGTFPTDFGQSMAVVFAVFDMNSAGVVFTTIADINTIPGITLSNYTFTDPAGAVLVDTTGDMSTGAVTVLIDGVAPPALEYIDMDFSATDTLVGYQDFWTPQANDYLFGLTADDTINAGAGDDLVFGGTGFDLIRGEAGNDVLFGNEGNDDLRGGTGNDMLSGGAGDDWLEGDEGSDTLDGGAGWDIADYRLDNSIGSTTGITASLVTNTVIDTTGSTDTLISIEEIVGSDFADSITGGDQNDWLSGEGGNDTLVGGAGDDDLSGGAGDDIVSGGAGDDWLEGNEGSDTLNGGAGWDVADYRFDNSIGSTTGITASLVTNTVIDTTGSTDTLIAIEGISGSNFADSITGGDLNDWLSGEAGNDTLSGGAGNDYLEGGLGDDTMTGGAGNDQFRIFASENNGNDIITDFVAGASTDDFIDFDLGVDYSFTFDQLMAVTTQVGADTVIQYGVGRSITLLNVTKANLVESDFSGLVRADIVGTAAGETIDGTALADTIYGNGGDDTLNGLAGADWLYGGDGNDTLNGGNGDDWLFGEAGNDILDGGAGWDFASYIGSTSGVNVNFATGIAQDGLGGTDTLVNIEVAIGSNFDDVLTGSAANESFTGAAGDDVIDGGGGRDTVWYGRAPAAVTVDLATGAVTGGDGNDTLTSIGGLFGSNFSDTLYGDSGENWFRLDQSGDIYTPNYLIGGDDYVDGRGGFDGVSYRNAAAGVVVDLANETATDARGNADTLISIELIRGSSFDDTLTGSAADNRFRGGDGNDTMDGGAGTDTAVFEFNFADAAISITNGVVTVASGGFTDTLTNFESYEFSDGVRDVSDLVAGNQTITGTAGDDNVTGGSGADTLNGGAGNDAMSGGAGDDTIDGGDGDDVIVDGLGNDQITGGAGSDSITVLSGNNTVSGGLGSDYLVGGFQADTLDGGSGNDVIMGDGAGGFLSGSDRITGGTEDDIMMGGGGADTFVFAVNDGADIIAAFNAVDVVYDPLTGYSATPTGADFTSGIDNIELVGFAGIDASNVMNSVTSGVDGAVFSASGTSITFFGVDTADLSADDFIFV